MYQNKIAYVALVINKENIACGWLEPSLIKNSIATKKLASTKTETIVKTPIIVRAYQKLTIDSCFGEQVLFNPTYIDVIVSDFIRKYDIKKPYISTAFASPIIAEKFILNTHTFPDPTQLIASHVASYGHHIVWDYFYAYPTDTDDHVFYFCAATQSLLFQYKLFALRHAFDLLTTTSKTSALLQLYRYMYGTAFRTAQLGTDMQKHNNNLEYIFTEDTLNRILSLSPSIDIIKSQERESLLTMAGLFVAQGNA